MDREEALTLLCDTSWWEEAPLQSLDELLTYLEGDEAKHLLCGEDSNSLLHLAIISSPYTEVVEYLLNSGFFTWVRNRLGQNPLDITLANNRSEALETLQEFFKDRR